MMPGNTVSQIGNFGYDAGSSSDSHIDGDLENATASVAKSHQWLFNIFPVNQTERGRGMARSVFVPHRFAPECC